MTRDLDRSVRYFLNSWGIGPWYIGRNIKAPTLYKGLASDTEISIALSHSGELQFEIIQQHNEAPSVYRDALAASPSLHVQHVAVWVDDIASVKERAMANGWEFVLEGPTGPGESCYVVHPNAPGICVEISDRSPLKEGVRALVRDIAFDWDGTDPIREGLPQLVTSAVRATQTGHH